MQLNASLFSRYRRFLPPSISLSFFFLFTIYSFFSLFLLPTLFPSFFFHSLSFCPPLKRSVFHAERAFETLMSSTTGRINRLLAEIVIMTLIFDAALAIVNRVSLAWRSVGSTTRATASQSSGTNLNSRSTLFGRFREIITAANNII